MVVIIAIENKGRMKPRRVRAMAMTIQYGVRGMILTAQSEAFKQDNVPWVEVKWMRPMHQGTWYIGADKTILLQCQRLLACYNSLRYLSENEKESPWILSLNFQGQSSEYDVIWVMVDRLTKLAHLLAIQEDFKM
ncbi:hypothetical protein Tco_1476892 [Tanacetum coccineum]